MGNSCKRENDDHESRRWRPAAGRRQAGGAPGTPRTLRARWSPMNRAKPGMEVSVHRLQFVAQHGRLAHVLGRIGAEVGDFLVRELAQHLRRCADDE